MGLIAWFPLNGNLNNQGLIQKVATGDVSYTSGKITSLAAKMTSGLNAAKTIDSKIPYQSWNYLQNSTSMCGWFKFNQAELKSQLEGLSYTSTNSTSKCALLGKNDYGGLAIMITTNNIYSEGSLKNISVYGAFRGKNSGGSTVQAETGKYTLSYDKWYFLCLVNNLSTGKLQLYIDGALSQEIDNKISQVTSINQYNFYINTGCCSSGNSLKYSFPASVNDVRLYDHALSIKEVKELSRGLQIHYDFENLMIVGNASYTRVNYLALQDRYFNTGVTDNNSITTKAVIEMSYYSTSPTNQINGFTGNAGSGIGTTGSNWWWGPSGSIKTDEKYVLEFVKHGSYYSGSFNGVVVEGTNGNTGIPTSNPFLIGAAWETAGSSNVAYYHQRCKIYGVKIYQNDVIVRDFVPCFRNSDGKPGLLDIVNNVFYTSQTKVTNALINDALIPETNSIVEVTGYINSQTDTRSYFNFQVQAWTDTSYITTIVDTTVGSYSSYNTVIGPFPSGTTRIRLKHNGSSRDLDLLTFYPNVDVNKKYALMFSTGMANPSQSISLSVNNITIANIPDVKIYDKSGYGHNATVVNAATVEQDSALLAGGKSYKTSTTNSWFETPYLGNPSAYTLAIWFKLGAAGAMPFGYGWDRYCYGDNSWKYTGGELYYNHNGGAASTSNYVFWVATWDGSMLKIYRNGVFESESNIGGGQMLTPLCIGSNSISGYTSADSKIGDVKIYATALSAADIKELFEIKASIDNRGNLYCYKYNNGGSTNIQLPTRQGYVTAQDLNSEWVPICIHYIPKAVFSANSGYDSLLIEDAKYRYTNFGIINTMARPESKWYEFKVEHQTTPGGPYKTYIWKQDTNPWNATWNDVNPSVIGSKVIKISSDPGNASGGMYWYNDSSCKMCFANSSNGNWFGCGIRAYWGTGYIPSYNNEQCHGWQKVYMKVSSTALQKIERNIIQCANLYAGNINNNAVNFRQLAYITSHGTEYINTAVSRKDEYGTLRNVAISVEVKANATTTGCIVGAGTADSAGNGWGFYVYNSKNMAFLSPGIAWYQFMYPRTFIVDYKLTFKGSTCSCFSNFDGIEQTKTDTYWGNYPWANDTFKLFKGSYPAGSNQFVGDMYSCKIYTTENELARDFIPVQSKLTGEVGMWDRVTHSFYGNCGTGAFSPGPVVSEFIE